MKTPRIALLSLACRFPEAGDTPALWQNVYDGRRSFRPIPQSRLALDEYDAARIGQADSIPRIPAALLDDWTFSRADFRIPKGTFETADLTHWLALDVAAQALAAIGGAEQLPRDRTAVIIGDTLTGEFTRSAQLRLRVPYLGRRLEAVLAERCLDPADTSDVVAEFLAAVSSDFPDPNEESLAGALANTIAGRIANHFDLHGGAWTVDGACASSLLAIADGCGRLMTGDVDVALVGGVDLSLDPFELVGFARAGALAVEDMRVFDRRAAGFWPGEGCGVAVLASEAAAARMGGTPLAWIRGWGVSTDGAGGLTRPTVAGQSRALAQAWRRAGVDPARASFFEAHGTGTAVGDPTEIRGLSDLVGPMKRAIPVGSIKGNIGHCKAAAGIAGVIKATCALQHAMVPPHVGCEEQHPVFADTGSRLAPAQAEALHATGYAGVSGFGFGGVNAHVVLEGPAKSRAAKPRPVLTQDAELFLFAAKVPAALRDDLIALRGRAGTMSLGEITDAAAAAATRADQSLPYRTAVVARRPEELVAALDAALSNLPEEPVAAEGPPRIGFLFPGQSAPVRPSGGAWARRFPAERGLIEAMNVGDTTGDTATRKAQPAIVASSLFGLRLLDRFGIRAEAAAGHSLGEICSLFWGGALGETDCLALAAARGRVMEAHGRADGSMARLGNGADKAARLAERYGLVIACLNGAEETVLSGDKTAIERLCEEQDAEELRVSHAFHSPHMAPATKAFAGILADTSMQSPSRPVVSTISGDWLSSDGDLRAGLLDQLTHPVRFTQALSKLGEQVDLLVEVGPGAGLTRIAWDAGATCLPIDACASTLRPFLLTLAELWRRGAALDVTPLFADRPIREFSLTPPRLLTNPCGVAEGTPIRAAAQKRPQPRAGDTPPAALPDDATAAVDVLDIVRSAVAEELGLPLASVAVDARLLDDLHLNSLSVGRIVAAAAARLGMASPAAVMDLTNVASVDIAAHLSELRDLGQGASREIDRVEGVAPWIAEYETLWLPAQAPLPGADAPLWRGFGDALPPEAAGLSLSVEGQGALVFLAAPQGAANSAATARSLWHHVKAARESGAAHITIVHCGLATEGFARSLLADGSFQSAKVIDMALRPDGWDDVDRLLRVAPRGFTSWRLAPEHGVLRPELARRDDGPADAPAMPCPQDVALVIGGARGIGAECALRLAARHGVALALVGRSPADALVVQQTLDRAHALGVRALYSQADAASLPGMRKALAWFAAQDLHPTIVLHAAGANSPAGFDSITPDELDEALAPKLDGLEAVLEAVGRLRVKSVIGFGSIIGTLGLAGETHYALANDMMSERLACWGTANGVRTLALDWSVWAGAGMGESLGVVERLQQTGVDAIPLDAALDRFDALVCDPAATGRRIVTSRFGPPPYVRFATPDVPALRFLEVLRIHFPQVELVADATLARGSDPWLDDHVVDGTPIMPGVMLLEAAAQAAVSLTGDVPRGFEEVRFERAVALGGLDVTLRTAALHEGGGRVSVVLRASDDGFSADRARMVVLTRPVAAPDTSLAVPAQGNWPAAELYGALFFNAGRFRRIDALERVSAFSTRVRLAGPASGADRWFGPYLAQDLVLGDPGARDAGLHALQACAPQRSVLPVSVSRIVLHETQAPRVLAEARETWSDGDRFRFDVAWRDAGGRTVETWHGAEFHAVSEHPVHGLPFWAMPAVLERAAATVCDRRDLRVAVEAAKSRAGRRAEALDRLELRPLGHRGDGAPELTNGDALSISHDAAKVLVATGAGPLGVDLVDAGLPCMSVVRPAERRLVQDIASVPGWTTAAAAAAVWSAREALRKLGAGLAGDLHLEPAPKSGGIVLRCEGCRVICIGCGADGCAALAMPIAASARTGPDPVVSLTAEGLPGTA